MKGGGFGPHTHMQLTPEQTADYQNYRIQKLEALVKSLTKSNDKLMAQLVALQDKGSIKTDKDQA